MNLLASLLSIVHVFFFCYTMLLFLRVISSWFPFHWQTSHFVRFLAFYTDPYLNFFRNIIPPLGGTLDLSPILAFLTLRFAEILIISIVRWVF